MGKTLAFISETHLYTHCSKCKKEGPKFVAELDEVVRRYEDYDWRAEGLSEWICPDCQEVRLGLQSPITSTHAHRWVEAAQKFDVKRNTLLDVALFVLTARQTLWDAFLSRQWSEANTLSANIEYFSAAPRSPGLLSYPEQLLLKFLNSLMWQDHNPNLGHLAADLPDDLMNVALMALLLYRRASRASSVKES